MRLTVGVYELVQVRLTEAGRKVWIDYNTKPFENTAAVTGASKIVCVPLWELMHIFGSALKDSQREPLFEDDQVELRWL